MAHELSITVERDGKHFVESSVEPGKVLEGPFDTEQEALERSIARSDEFEKSTGSTIFIEGLGLIEIEGDVPSEQELQAILEAIGDPESESPPPIPEPIIPESMFPTSGGTPLSGEGPLGLMPTETRSGIRRSVEKQPGLSQLVTEISPSVAGTGIGATLGTLAGPGFGTLLGGMIGGGIGELFAQETGIAPKSDLNAMLAIGGPLAGPVVGGALKGVRRGAGFAVTRGLPASKVARARNLMGRAVSEFESIGTTILSKQKGIASRTASEIFETAKRAKVRITPNLLKPTRDIIAKTVKELGPVSSIPEVRQSMRALEQISKVMLNNPKGVLLDELIRARSFVGSIIGNLRNKGGIKLGTAKQIFATLSDDLDNIARSPFRKGRQARLAKEGIKRAKLEFAVKDLENAVAKFTVKDPAIPDGIRIDFKGMQKWLDDITNPKRTGKFDKNFTTALADNLPELKKRIGALADLAASASPGGPGSIVLRGQSAKIGRALVGGALGFLGTGGSAIGAAVGGIAFAQAPEMIVAMLTTRPGAAFLEAAAKAGKGQISWRAWLVASEIVFRSLGEKGGLPSSPGGPKSSSVGPVTIDTPATLRDRAKAEETAAGEVTIEPKRKRLSEETKGFLRPPIAN